MRNWSISSSHTSASQHSLLQQPRRRQTHTQMQQRKMSVRKPAAPAIKIVMFKGSRRRGKREFPQCLVRGARNVNSSEDFNQNHLHSITFSCWATQLLGAPTLLEDSQRYMPASVLDTLFNFCSRQRQGERWITENTSCLSVRVFCTFNTYSPVCPCLRPRCMACLLWPSKPCCLCTSGRWQEARWVCPYSGAPGLSPQTQSSEPRRTAHEEALRKICKKCKWI